MSLPFHRFVAPVLALVVVGCNYTPAGQIAPSGPAPTAMQPADAIAEAPSIEPYAPQATSSSANPVVVPREIDPPQELLPTAAAIADSVNRLRAATGVEPLVVDEGLTRLAFARSADMVVRGYLSHEDPVDGSNLPWRLLTEAGYGGLLGENVFATQAPLDEVVDEAVDGWLRNAAHRAVALDPAFRFTGVGLLSDGEWWKVTQVFAGQLP